MTEMELYEILKLKKSSGRETFRSCTASTSCHNCPFCAPNGTALICDAVHASDGYEKDEAVGNRTKEFQKIAFDRHPSLRRIDWSRFPDYHPIWQWYHQYNNVSDKLDII